MPHWKCVLWFCEKSPSINILHQETNKDTTNMCSKISFHVYRNLSRCNVHGIRPYEERTICSMCSTDLSSITPIKLYTQKELVLLETLISQFHKNDILQKFKNWHSISHMCSFLEHITVAKKATINLYVRSNNMMFYSVVLM